MRIELWLFFRLVLTPYLGLLLECFFQRFGFSCCEVNRKIFPTQVMGKFCDSLHNSWNRISGKKHSNTETNFLILLYQKFSVIFIISIFRYKIWNMLAHAMTWKFWYKARNIWKLLLKIPDLCTYVSTLEFRI